MTTMTAMMAGELAIGMGMRIVTGHQGRRGLHARGALLHPSLSLFNSCLNQKHPTHVTAVNA